MNLKKTYLFTGSFVICAMILALYCLQKIRRQTEKIDKTIVTTVQKHSPDLLKIVTKPRLLGFQIQKKTVFQWEHHNLQFITRWNPFSQKTTKKTSFAKDFPLEILLQILFPKGFALKPKLRGQLTFKWENLISEKKSQGYFKTKIYGLRIAPLDISYQGYNYSEITFKPFLAQWTHKNQKYKMTKPIKLKSIHGVITVRGFFDLKQKTFELRLKTNTKNNLAFEVIAKAYGCVGFEKEIVINEGFTCHNKLSK